MTNEKFESIVEDIIATFLIEDMIIPDSVIDKLRYKYVNEEKNGNKVLVKNRGGKFNDNRRK